jgi:hypothetical protein
VTGLSKDAGLELARQVFDKNEYEILGSRFKLYFRNDGSLMLEQISWTTIPEPGVYSLFSYGLLAGLMLIHRRRGKEKSARENKDNPAENQSRNAG